MPKAARDQSLVDLLESRVSQLSGFTPLLLAGKNLKEIMRQLLGDLELFIFPESHQVKFHCGCSWKRVLGALKMLGEAELRDMIEKDEGAEAICQFCGEVYQADETQLTRLIADLKSE